MIDRLSNEDASLLEEDTRFAAGAPIEQMVADAVAIRDGGEPARALTVLQHLSRLYPDARLPVLESLVIATIHGPKAELVANIELGLTDELRQDPHIRLFLAHHHRALGDIPKAIDWIGGVTFDSVSAIPSFRIVWNEVFQAISRFFTAKATILATCGEGTAMAMVAGNLTRLLAGFTLGSQDDPDVFFRLVHEAAFLSPQRRPLLELVQVLDEIAPYLPTEHKAIAFFFVVAVRQFDTARGMLDRLADEALSLHPMFLKALVFLADDTGDETGKARAGALIERFCAMPEAARPQWRFTLAALQGIEIGGRFLADRPGDAQRSIGALPRLPPTLAPIAPVPLGSDAHLYIGFFGQVRFGATTMPEIARFLRSDLEPLVELGTKISTGVATWRESAQRVMNLHDSSVFIYDLLPEELMRLLQPRELIHVEQVVELIPAMGRQILEASARTEVIDKARIESMLQGPAFTDISDEESFSRSLGQRMMERLQNSVTMVNQGRMWDRIGAHASLIRQAEAATGRPVTHAIMLRPDLVFTDGSLLSTMRREGIALSSGNRALTDHDPHASYIEGWGDRYIIADRAALQHLLEGRALLDIMFRPDGAISPAYARRLGPHMFLSTLLFERRTVVKQVPRAEVNFEIYRGRLDWRDLREAAADDAASSPSPEVRALLDRALRERSPA